ncbi:MAG: DNA translocase FtsK 4TM domain-containing protein [Patescibacteria group bacterium]
MSRYRHYSIRPPKQQTMKLDVGISRGLLSILLFIVSALSLLSFFNLAGVAGHFIDSLLAITFGQVRYVFPFVLIIVAVLMIRDMDYQYRPTHLIGSVIFFLSFNGLVHLQRPLDQMTDNALQGNGGGLAGLALAWPLLKYASYWGATVVLAGLLIASIIFLFNTTLARLVELHKKAFMMFGWIGRKIISFGEFFKREKVKFKIKGDYEVGADNENDGNGEIDVNDKNNENDEEENERNFERRTIKKTAEDTEVEDGAVPEEKEPNENIVISKPKKDYNLPSLELLSNVRGKPTSGDIKANAEIIKDTLMNFGIEVEMGEVRVGPTVTQYSLKPFKGVKLASITALSNDLALALAAHPIRIEAPIPGQSLVGIEVPNQKVALVTLRELLESPEFKNREHNMVMAIGKDVAGKVHVGDLTKMPHLLVAGATNSGKTVCINTLILSLLYQNTPETLRFIMVDPKRVELPLYNGIPHLLTPVITDAVKTINALRWTIGEMDRRFSVLASSGKRDIASYNKSAVEKMPNIVFIIDELADLMASSSSEIEGGIIRIAQMARAVGIHLIVATQSPRVEVITGLMKANIPARIAFSVQSNTDSRTILDTPGAEKLLGRGDMLYLTADMSKPKRLQGAFVSEDEMKDIVNFLRGDEPPEYDEAVVAKNGASPIGTINMFGGPSDDQDPMFDEAKRVIIESGKASASLLQRRLKLGYARAARVLDELEKAGIVGPADGAKPREVFTEHLGPTPEVEIPIDEQTLDAGGTVLDDNSQNPMSNDQQNQNE